MHRVRMTAFSLAAWVSAIVLLVFNLRRLIFLSVATFDLVAGRRQLGAAVAPEPTADVLILVALRNEVASLPELMACLLALRFPPARLAIGLVDDGSTDGSAAQIDAYAQAHERVSALHLLQSRGKASALNAGLHRWPGSDIVVVYDADARPQPDSLAKIVAAFDDGQVAAAGGLVRPSNGLATSVATYGAVERLVHQQVTVRAKDRLALAPAILGSNCAYRRADLEAAGGFPDGALLEDSHLTVRLARAGRTIRFLPDAVAHDRVPESLVGYWRQHVRWGRGFHDVLAGDGRDAAGLPRSGHPESGRPPSLLRLELILFSMGYLDRLALSAALPLIVAAKRWGSRRSASLLTGLVGCSLLLPYLQIALTLLAERASTAWWLRLPLVPLFFAVDVAAAVWSLALSLARRPQRWQPTERTGPPGQRQNKARKRLILTNTMEL